VTVGNDAAHEVGVVDRRRTNHKERRTNVVFPQDVEDLRQLMKVYEEFREAKTAVG
jgi:hypothetical protein